MNKFINKTKNMLFKACGGVDNFIDTVPFLSMYIMVILFLTFIVSAILNPGKLEKIKIGVPVYITNLRD